MGDPEEFVNTVLKALFKGCKYSSFVRKLHRWGFVRLTSGTGTDCFHHPLFRKGRSDLCALIQCTPRNESGAGGVGAGGFMGGKGGPASALTHHKSASAIAASVGADDKPPSLAGVEKFI